MVSKWWVACAALSTLLAGCIGDAPGADPEGPDSLDSSVGDGNETVETNVTNTAPVASLIASAVNGTAPLNVTFTIDGSDADGDDLTWSLTIGNDTQTGADLPATVNATLDAGNHTIALVVSDGNLTDEQSLAIAVDAAAVAGPSVEPVFTVLEMLEGCELCIDSQEALGEPMGAAGCIGWNTGDNELDCGWVEIPDGYAGTPFSVFSYTSGTLAPFGTDGHPDVEFWDACDHGGSVVEQVFDQDGDKVVGVIPEGAGCIVAFEFHWPNVGHTIEVSLGAVAHE